MTEMSHINHGATLEDVEHSNPDKHRQQPQPAPAIEENKFIKYVRPCISEALQVTIFVFVGTTAACISGGNIVQVALAHGLTIGLLIMGAAKISGGHINPAVTLGVTLSGGLHPLMAIPYVISQLIGSLIGAAICFGVLGESVYAAGYGGGQFPQANSISLEPYSEGQCVLAEIIATMILVGSVLLTAVDEDGKNPVAPFAIGFSVLVDILAIGPVSGASMNPARSFGPAVVLSAATPETIWTGHWIYWVGPAGGAILAAAFYRFLLARPQNRLILKPKMA